MASSTPPQPVISPLDSPSKAGDLSEEPLLIPGGTETGVTKLPEVLGKRDLAVLMLLIVLFIANTNDVQFGGPATFVYWTLGLLTFLIPCAFVTQWLARRFPGQGAPYLWATRILGPRWSFFSAFCAWLPGVLAVVSAIECGIIFIHYLAPTWFTTPIEQGLAVVLVLMVPTAIACLPLRWLKHILLVIAALYVGVFVLLGITGIYWLWSGHPPAIALNVPGAWLPGGGNFAVYGVVILAYLGVDTPLFMGGELRGGKAGARRASSYVWWGIAIAFLAYVMGTFGIMVVVPAARSGAISANAMAIQMVFGPLAGNAVAIVLAASQVALTIAYILVFSRLLVVAAQDYHLPLSLARINARGVPVLSIILQAAVVAIVTILSLVIIPSLFGTFIRPDNLALEVYNVMQAGTTVVWLCSIIELFVLVLWFLYHHKRWKETSKGQRVLLLNMCLVGTGSSLVGIWATVSSSWLPSRITNGHWAILVLGITVISIVVGAVASEIPRVHALLSEQKRLNDREMKLRAQLQEAYNEQEILVQQQQILVGELDRLYREQALAAVTDAITGLPNHRAIMSRIDEELSRCQRTGGSCAILFADLDHFKRINDTWGHLAGDTILREVGNRLRATLRQEDFVGRYGGEEFAVVLTEADIHGATEVGERLRAAVASEACLWQTEDAVLPITATASIGAAVYQLHGVTREELVERADNAMYQAKLAGRNCVCIADVEMEPAQNMPLRDDRQVVATVPVQVVQAFAAMAGAHDPGTSGHSHRLMRLAEATAREMGYPEEQMYLVRLAALLHDIGKVGIPDAILHKPGPLTTEEWRVMRRHPEISRQILEQVGGVFQQVACIVVAHHEHWDGKGYPSGLVGEDIPPGARILAVVDAYDAMTFRRSYREPISQTEARAELQRCAGTQFDPQVVEAFMRVLVSQEEHMPEESEPREEVRGRFIAGEMSSDFQADLEKDRVS